MNKWIREYRNAWMREYQTNKYKTDPVWKKNVLERNAKWKAENPKRYRDMTKNCKLKKSLGITLQDKQMMLKKQQRKCAICLKLFRGSRIPHVDHCHVTGRIRGLLCMPCNTALGRFQDSIIVLERAIGYLNGN